MFKNAFANLQKVGKSLMLPVSVLPIAGILLGVGSAISAGCPPLYRMLWQKQAVPSLQTCH